MPRVSIENIKDLDPRRGYQLSDFEFGDPYMWWGYENSEGQWFIMRNELVDGLLEYWETKYSKGDSNYATGWAGMGGLTYDYYEVIF